VFNVYHRFEITRVGILWFDFAKIKGAKIILHMKLLTFMAARLKVFTVNKQ